MGISAPELAEAPAGADEPVKELAGRSPGQIAWEQR